jgi:hypothetical protein
MPLKTQNNSQERKQIMTELQAISTEVCHLVQSMDTMTTEQAKHMNTFNDSMQFYIEHGDEAKCLYVANEARNYLYSIL